MIPRIKRMIKTVKNKKRKGGRNYTLISNSHSNSQTKRNVVINHIQPNIKSETYKHYARKKNEVNGKIVLINTKNITTVEPYFDKISSITDAQKQQLLSLLCTKFKIKTLVELQNEIQNNIIGDSLPLQYPCASITKWIECTKPCNKKKLIEFVKNELESTAYIIYTISKSLLIANKLQNSPPPISFIWDESKLTGEWKNDRYLITLKINNEYITSTPRLIMGFGPSAAGKTYWAQTLINLFSMVPNFPKLFLSIDGGLYRETSMVYQMIIRTVKKTCITGFNDLVSPKAENGIFNANIVKNNIHEYLTISKLRISLYVPETLGACGWKVATRLGFTKECIKTYQKYIDLTGDTKWIGTFIWQHRLNSDCTFEDAFKCKGCEESGTSREKNEGKKYSSMAYNHSISKGNKHIMKAPGGCFKIHNTGGRKFNDIFNKTTIEDVTPSSNELSKILSAPANIKKYNYVYHKINETVNRTNNTNASNNSDKIPINLEEIPNN